MINPWTEFLFWNHNLKSLGHDNTSSVFSEPQPVDEKVIGIYLEVASVSSRGKIRDFYSGFNEIILYMYILNYIFA